jgi:hypothetical protein
MLSNVRPRSSLRAPLVTLLVALSCFSQACAGSAARDTAPATPSLEVVTAQAPLPALAQRAASPTAGASARAATPSAPDPAATEPRAVERKIIRDATLTLEVRNETLIPRVLLGVHAATEKLGGYVASESTHGIVIKVPSARLDDALGALGTLARITKRDVTARDVTSDYVDLGIRIDNARRLQERLRELVGQTQDVARLLDLEKELAHVTEELERYEGQMRLMNNQTTFATLTLTVEESVSPGPVGWVFVGLYKGVKWLFVWD